MAERKSFPSVPERNWWDLRRRFLSSPPKGEVSAAYLSDVLGVQEKAAKNIIPSLRAVGLIDEKNKQTPLAARWRDDEQYAEVTREIIAAVYPQSLLDAAPPDSADAVTVQRWFLRETGAGQARANQLAAFYRLLAAGDPSGGEDVQRRTTERQTTPARQQTRQTTPRRSGAGGQGDTADGAWSGGKGGDNSRTPLPSLSVAVQVYIDKDMTAEQVDHVFASMARHLYGRE